MVSFRSLGRGLFRPDYNHSIVDTLSSSVDECLWDTDIENLAFFFLDSLGGLENRSTFLSELMDDFGEIRSSVFPSVTSSCLASVITGSTPAEHGLYGHVLYRPEFGYRLDHLTLEDKDAGVCRNHSDAELCRIMRNPPIWSSAPVRDAAGSAASAVAGISTKFRAHESIAYSGLSRYLYTDAETEGYEFPLQAFWATRREIVNVQSARKKAGKSADGRLHLQFVYDGELDSLVHDAGTNDGFVSAKVRSFASSLKAFIELLPGDCLDSTFVVVATDHGQSDFDPREDRPDGVSQSQQDRILELSHMLPGKSGRVLHLYPLEGKEDALLEFINEEICRTEDALILDFDKAWSLMGGGPKLGSEKRDLIQSIVGDRLIALPAGIGVSLSLRSKDADPPPVANHGSLTLEELRVPFIAFRASEVV